MYRFFIDARNICGSTALIAGDEAHHITNVLRLGKGDQVVVCDGEGYEYTGLISSSRRGEVEVDIMKVEKSATEPPVRITLAQGIPKKTDKLEMVFQKATELGVSRLVPLMTRRSLGSGREGNRLQRWQRICLEASKQSQRAKVPVVDPPLTLIELLESFPRDALCLIPWEEEKTLGLREVLRRETAQNMQRQVLILVGPEGGFAPEEVDLAQKAGAIPVSLGPRVLRTETAGILALGMVMYELGDLGGGGGE